MTVHNCAQPTGPSSPVTVAHRTALMTVHNCATQYSTEQF